MGALTALLAVVLTALLGLSGASASPPEPGDPSVMTLAQQAEAFKGTLRDRGADNAPLPGVTILVTTLDGELVGTAVSDDDGNWLVPVPGPGTYLIELDDSTLPEGVLLANPDRRVNELAVQAGNERTVLFAVGSGPGGGSTQASGTLSRLASATFAGLLFGLIIAMTAIGLSLIFGTTGLVNFAHGELVSIGAIGAWWLNSPNHLGGKLSIIPAAIIAIAATAGLGAGLEKGLWKPLRARHVGLVQMLVVSIGLSLGARALLQVIFGGGRAQYFDYALQGTVTLGPLTTGWRDISILAISIATLVGVAVMLQGTRIGKAMRAVADNRDLAESSGIDVDRVVLVVWVVGGGLAGLGGILFGLDQAVSNDMGFRLLLLMFAGIILGGLGTAYGAMLGALVVGLVTEWSTVLGASPDIKVVWALLVMIIILLVRPQGILGQRERFG